MWREKIVIHNVYDFFNVSKANLNVLSSISSSHLNNSNLSEPSCSQSDSCGSAWQKGTRVQKGIRNTVFIQFTSLDSISKKIEFCER